MRCAGITITNLVRMRRASTVRLVQAVFAIICTTSFLYLLQSHRGITRYTSAQTDPLDTQSYNWQPADDDHVRRVRDFWIPFEQHIHDAKPNAPKIQFARGEAGARGVDDNDAVREETYNFVSNPEVADELARAHDRFRTVLDFSFDKEGRPTQKGVEGVFRGEGVVTVAGGEYFGPAIVGIHMLRRTGSNLPVEAFVANIGEYEQEVCETILPKLNARCIVLTDFIDTASFEITHYQLKALAILFSSFNHVLYLDSDSIPLVDPQTEFFAKEPYTSKGLVNWPDFWRATESPLFYRIAGLSSFPKGLPATSTEAGQLLVDKTRHLKTLLLAVYYNIYGPKWYYPLLSQGALGQGDKNTFESAAIVLGLPWYRVHTPVKALGRLDAGEFRGSAMVQSHPGDDYLRGKEIPVSDAHKPEMETQVRPAFVHANTPKLNAGHLADEGDLQDDNTNERLRLWGPASDQVKLFGFDVEKEAFQYVVETGCKWGAVLEDWKNRDELCKRLMEHYSDVFFEASIGNSTI
jgi:alpha 1,2-mannosyltransferase